MTTSYTALLGLALPVTGELAGTWGDTVSNSITGLLDTAVAGTTTLSTDADVTLTTTTGAANQARQAILLCSGARTAVRNITAPAQSKMYVVINNTTGGYGVVIRGVGPTTGVTVASGKTTVVVWNGSDFVEVTNSPILIGGTGTTSALTLRSTSGVGTTGADIIFQVGNNGATEALRILNSGFVGIGTNAPSSPLTVYAGNNQATIKLTNGPSANNVGLTLESLGGNVVLNNGNGPFELSTGGAIRTVVTTTGNFLIGATSVLGSAIKKLQIGDRSETVALSLQGPTANGSVMELYSGTQTSLYIGGGASYNMFSAGQVGIATGAAIPLLFGTNNLERLRIDSSGNVGIGSSSPVNKLDINGSLGRNAPVTKTTSFTLAATENWLICNGTATITVTLPAASSWTGREVMIKNIAAFTVVSASSNVVPLAGGAAGTAILPATAGAKATLVSDGTNWIIMQ